MQVQKPARHISTGRRSDGWHACYSDDPENGVKHKNRETAIKILQERDEQKQEDAN